MHILGRIQKRILLFYCIGRERGFTMFIQKFIKYRKVFFITCFIYVCVFFAEDLYDSIPEEIYVTKGNMSEIEFSFPVTTDRKDESIAVFGNGAVVKNERYVLCCEFLDCIPIKEVTVHVVDKTYVMPAGVPVGIYTKTDGVLVLGTGAVEASDGLNYEPAEKIVHSGDYILEANGQEIYAKEELVECVNASEGEAVELKIQRDGDMLDLQVEPVALGDGSYKLGIWVRDDMAGVGTMTYITKESFFGALGHPVSDADTGNGLHISGGKVYNTDIIGIVKGKDGTPGELTGVINYNDEFYLGEIEENTFAGVYGKLEQLPENVKEQYVEVAMKQEIKKGKAYIWSSLGGEMAPYEIKIDLIDYNSEEKNKGILFHVTDEKLIEKTGGIVQGMSGSPIIQNGKIIGAVTHVFVNDPTKGYGIFIEEMLGH